jgi:hypothetical protein
MKIDAATGAFNRMSPVRERSARTGDGFQQAMTMAARRDGINSATTASDRDFRSMTPRQMHGVANALHAAGKIDATQLLMLQTAGMPIGKMGPSGEYIPLSDAEKASYGNRPVNYLQTITDAIAHLEQTGAAYDPKSGYEAWKGILLALQGS